MLKLIRKFFSPPEGHGADPREKAPSFIDLGPAGGLRFHDCLARPGGFPMPDWEPLLAKVGAIADPELQDQAWRALERAWMLHMRDALGAHFHVLESAHCMVLTSQERHIAKATLAFMDRSLSRVLRTLDGLGQLSSGKDLLIVFDNEESYYRYVSQFSSAKGEVAGSSGMFISNGCGHFVMPKGDLAELEPTIAHEMTHSSLSHLHLPLWLDEGIAVNTEYRVSRPAYARWTPEETRAKHLKHWTASTIQAFWSGASFSVAGDTNTLSYDLARMLVLHLGKDWAAFRAFANAANWQDGGAAAMLEVLGCTPGALACALFEQEPDDRWEPAPSRW